MENRFDEAQTKKATPITDRKIIKVTWQEFDTRHGNDLEESPFWQYHVPETVMGRLRLRGLLVEATVNDELLVVVPAELRQPLGEILA